MARQNSAGSGERLIVGFESSEASHETLRWALERAAATLSLAVVVHASSEPIRAVNGPSAAVAESLGNPAWATVHTTVRDLDPCVPVTTIVEPGTPAEVLAHHAQPGDVIVLGPRRSRLPWLDTAAAIRRRTDCHVIRHPGPARTGWAVEPNPAFVPPGIPA